MSQVFSKHCCCEHGDWYTHVSACFASSLECVAIGTSLLFFFTSLLIAPLPSIVRRWMHLPFADTYLSLKACVLCPVMAFSFFFFFFFAKQRKRAAFELSLLRTLFLSAACTARESPFVRTAVGTSSDARWVLRITCINFIYLSSLWKCGVVAIAVKGQSIFRSTDNDNCCTCVVTSAIVGFECAFFASLVVATALLCIIW